MEQQFEVVKQAREWLKSQSEVRATEKTRVPSAATIEGYKREMTRLAKSSDPWKAASDTSKKSTFFKRRAAILHCCRESISASLKAQDLLQRDKGLLDPAKKAAWLLQIAGLKNSLNLALKAPEGAPDQLFEKRETKRKDLWKLPANWCELLIERMPNYRAQVAISALCGCRPWELEAGIAVSVSDGVLKLRISGAKVGQHSGQEWREITWKLPTMNPLAVMVAQMALKNGGQLLVKTANARAFSGAMRSAGRRAFPGFSHTITPYSLRHQVASDMKAADLGDEISKALGHSSANTRGSYGSAEFGSASRAPDAVEAARSIKQKLFQPEKPRLSMRAP